MPGGAIHAPFLDRELAPAATLRHSRKRESSGEKEPIWYMSRFQLADLGIVIRRAISSALAKIPFSEHRSGFAIVG
jgi:hypothetical protein